MFKERVNFVSEFWEQSHFFFDAPKEYDPKVVKKRWKENTSVIMTEIKEIIEKTDDFKRDNIEDVVKGYIEEKELGIGQVMNAFRLCLVGGGTGPDLFIIADMLGKEEVIKRIEAGVLNIKL